MPGRLDEHVRDQIVAETRGNPLALLELPRGLTPAELAGGFGLPDARLLASRVEETFVQRVQALPRETQRLHWWGTFRASPAGGCGRCGQTPPPNPRLAPTGAGDASHSASDRLQRSRPGGGTSPRPPNCDLVAEPADRLAERRRNVGRRGGRRGQRPRHEPQAGGSAGVLREARRGDRRGQARPARWYGCVGG